MYLVCWLERELISNFQLYIQQVLDFINASHSYCQNKPLLVKGISCGVCWIAFSVLFYVLFSLAHLSYVCRTIRITKRKTDKKFVWNKVFYDVMPYGLVDRYHCSTGTCSIHLEGRRDSCTQKIIKEYSFQPENLSTKLCITSENTIILKYSKLCYTNVLKSSPIHAMLVYGKHIIL